jgi:hypothetical protein
MLGEKIGEVSGALVVQRALPSEPGTPRMEVTQKGSGTLLGIPFQESGTYWSMIRPDGTVYGEGNGVYMGEGGALATWVGQGTGTIAADGSMKYRGAVYLYSTSDAWKQLNSVASLFEYEADADGNYHSELWEWK